VCRFKPTKRFTLLWNFSVYIVITCVDNFNFHLDCILGVVVANVVVGSMVVVVGSNVVVTSVVVVT